MSGLLSPRDFADGPDDRRYAILSRAAGATSAASDAAAYGVVNASRVATSCQETSLKFWFAVDPSGFVLMPSCATSRPCG